MTQILAACLAAARQSTPPGEVAKAFVSREGAKARRRLFYPQITQINADFGGLSCRCAAIHAAGWKDWEDFFSREGARARRRLFYPQITQINADFGGLSCRCAAIHAADGKIRKIFSHAKARRREEDFFIHRLRRLTQILAACLAAARQSTPPGERRKGICLTRRREGARDGRGRGKNK